ncbi:hypothetical protein [Conexibacter arvalis]|uniref:SnoaL-like domain-containing protein n=1 Tax=Conexibacter arvalis TaxID=912552 RepID=A0A840IDN4_9ACTN|nr:hypothetical protein [Conexibacter arvalis]MBB4662343.1 hypothetical protein [Conexibacter arvalis]
MARPATAAALLAATALALSLAGATAGCGGDGATTITVPDSGERGTMPGATVPRSVDPADERAIRTWADTLRRGDVAGAARSFARGSRVVNGGRPLLLDSRADALAFNRSLPCGAVVTAVEPSAHGFVLATFRLTERPGPGDCGDGTGRTARVAVRVDEGRISDWIRLEEIPQTPEDDAPGSPA